jgi:glyoxylase-like metal-dependent hydrolase (beta-lactamase superfamily II)
MLYKLRKRQSFSSHNGEIHTVFGRINPHYLIYNNGNIVVIDACFNSDSDLLLDYAQKHLDCSVDSIKLIVTTHYHLDHINGVDYLVNKTNAKVAAGANAAKYYGGAAAPARIKCGEILRLACIWLRDLCPMPAMRDVCPQPFAGIPLIRRGLKSKPEYWLQDGQALPLAPDWTVIHTMGHTDDSICLYNSKLRALITGDTIINVCGTPKLNPIVLRDKAAGKESLQRLKQLDIDHIYPGYGRPVSRPSIINYVS